MDRFLHKRSDDTLRNCEVKSIKQARWPVAQVRNQRHRIFR